MRVHSDLDGQLSKKRSQPYTIYSASREFQSRGWLTLRVSSYWRNFKQTLRSICMIYEGCSWRQRGIAVSMLHGHCYALLLLEEETPLNPLVSSPLGATVLLLVWDHDLDWHNAQSWLRENGANYISHKTKRVMKLFWVRLCLSSLVEPGKNFTDLLPNFLKFQHVKSVKNY